MSELVDVIGDNPHVRRTRIVKRFVPNWVRVTGFGDGVIMTPEERLAGLDKLVNFVKRRMASLLEDRCERGFDPVNAPWSRRFIGGHRCMRPTSDQEMDASDAEFLADHKAGIKSTPEVERVVNLCGPVSGPVPPDGTRFDADVARLGELDQGAPNAPPPSDRYAGWEPAQLVAWELHLSETRLHAFFREATGASARVVCDIMCARDAAHRIERAAERDLAAILDEVFAQVSEKSKTKPAEIRAGSFAMCQLVSAARRAWNVLRRSRGWSASQRAIGLGYKNHARLREALLLAHFPSPDGIELAVLERRLRERLGLPNAESGEQTVEREALSVERNDDDASASPQPEPLRPSLHAQHSTQEAARAPRAIFALARNAQGSPVEAPAPLSSAPAGEADQAASGPETAPVLTKCAKFSELSLPRAVHAEFGAGI